MEQSINMSLSSCNTGGIINIKSEDKNSDDQELSSLTGANMNTLEQEHHVANIINIKKEPDEDCSSWGKKDQIGYVHYIQTEITNVEKKPVVTSTNGYRPVEIDQQAWEPDSCLNVTDIVIKNEPVEYNETYCTDTAGKDLQIKNITSDFMEKCRPSDKRKTKSKRKTKHKLLQVKTKSLIQQKYFKCYLCDKNCKTEKALKLHIDHHHKTHKMDKDGKYKVMRHSDMYPVTTDPIEDTNQSKRRKVYKKTSNDEVSKREHSPGGNGSDQTKMRKLDEGTLLQMCKKPFYRVVLSKSERASLCALCGLSFNDESMKVMHKEASQRFLYKCFKCDMKFFSLCLFVCHMHSHNIILTRKDVQDIIDAEPSNTNIKFLIENNETGIKGKKSYQQCKQFSQIDNSGSSYECVFCGEEYPNEMSLAFHKAKIHSSRHFKYIPKYNNFHCERCKVKFGRLSLLSKHLQAVHNIDKDKLDVNSEQTKHDQCKRCLTILNSKTEQLKHKKLLGQDDALTCNSCNMSFYSQCHFKVHRYNCNSMMNKQ